jgi:hypothetical protein
MVSKPSLQSLASSISTFCCKSSTTRTSDFFFTPLVLPGRDRGDTFQAPLFRATYRNSCVTPQCVGSIGHELSQMANRESRLP